MLNGGLGLGMIFYAQDLASNVMARLEQRFKTLDSASEEVTRDLSDRFARMKMGLASMAAGGAVLGTLGAVSLAAGRAAAQMEMYTVALDTMLRQQGAGVSATQFLEDLRQFAKATPFEFTDLVEASKQLMAFGFRAEQILPMMRSIGDAVSALGGGAEAQQRVIWALGQMQAKGRVLAEELLQLQEVGVPVFQILQEELGLTADQVARIGELGIAAQQGIQAILAGMTKRFGGMMEVQSRTVMGILSNIRDAFQGILLDIGGTAETGFLAGLRGILEDIRDFLSDLDDRNVFRGLGDGLASLLAIVRPLVAGVMGMARGFALLFERRPELLSFLTTLAGVSAAALFLAGSVAVVRSGLAIAGRMAQWFGLSTATGLGPLLWWVTAITAAVYLLQQAYQRNWFGLRDFVAKARLAWQGFWSLVSTARFDGKQLVGSMLVEVRDALQRAGLLEFVLTAFMVFTRVRAFALGMAEGIRQAVGQVREAIQMLASWVQPLIGAVTQAALALGLLTGKAAAAPPSASWQTFGWVIGQAGVYALWTVGAILAARRTADMLRSSVDLATKSVGLLVRAWKWFDGVYAEVALRAMYAWDKVVLGWGRMVSAANAAAAAVRPHLLAMGTWLGNLGKQALATGRAMLAMAGAALRSSLAFLASPWGIVIAAIAALGAALYLLVTHWDAVRDAVVRAWAWLSGLFQQMPGWVTAVLAVVAPIIGIPMLLARNWSRVVETFQQLPGLVAGSLAMLPQFLQNLGQTLIQGVVNIGRSIIDGLVQGLDAVRTAVGQARGRIASLVGQMPGWAQTLLAALLPVVGIPLLLARNWRQVVATFQRLPGLVMGALSALPQLLAGVGKALWQGAVNIGRSIITGLVQGLRSVAGTLLGSLGPIGQALGSMLGLSPAAAPKPAGAPVVPAGLVPAGAAAGAAVAMPVPGFPMAPPVVFPATQAQAAARAAQAAQQVQPAPAPAAQPRGVSVRQPVQLVLDGRVLAQTVLEIRDEDERRAGRW